MSPDQVGQKSGVEDVQMTDAPPAAPRKQMQIVLADESAFQLRGLHASNQLSLKALPNGCLYAIERDGILINQLLASPLAGGIQRIYLRLLDGNAIRFVEIVGPGADSAFSSSSDRLVWCGSWQGLHYYCTCWLHPGGGGWFFHVEIENRTATSIRCDAVTVQDVGLATRAHVRNNELFTSQYLDHSVIDQPEVGYLLMTRQNLPQSAEKTNPWLLQGCLPRARGFATDGSDFFGAGYKGDGIPAALLKPIVGQRVRQLETAYTAIQSAEIELAPSASSAWTFFADFVPDHPESSASRDANRLQNLRALHRQMLAALSLPKTLIPTKWDRSVFQTCALFAADDFNDADIDRYFSHLRRHEEFADGRLHSLFYGKDSRHVVCKAKELATARPHGHIMRSGQGFTPDAELMSTACYAAGIFASQLALGNTCLGKLLSAIRDPLNLVRSNGLRIFVRQESSEPWQLLAVPSAFEMSPDQCRWHYKGGQNLLTVSCIASDRDPAFTFEVRAAGQPLELLICGEIAAGPSEYENFARLTVEPQRGRITVRPDDESLLGEKEPDIVFHIVTPTAGAIQAIGGDELLFAGHASRGLPYFAIHTHPTTSFTFTFLGTLGDSARADALCAKYENASASLWRPAEVTSRFWNRMTAGLRLQFASGAKAGQTQDALQWFARDALIHLSAPRGLEQPNAGAWGVRDVCQGPVEFLLSYDHTAIVADILRKVFSQQYQHRCDWPQWFMFPPFQDKQSSHCHGDVLIWPLKALCDYLEHTNDAAILQERLPYTDEETFQRTDRLESLIEHTDRLLQRMRQEFLFGLSLPRFGEGDWDDSLQPADPILRERMVSSWTAELMHQTLRRYGAALSHFGECERAATASLLAARIETDFQRHLVPDGVVAGFAVFGGEIPRPVEYLLHPSDTRTGLHYRLIPMTRGIISGIFSAEQANHHLDLLREHLVFPDGARLMDRPTSYQGGIERTFRRAESAAFFGREIGLQYVHAHLRYAEALAVMGRGDELWRALQVVNPIAVTDVVSNARPRQRNCYFSSSDAAFTDRYQASANYDQLRRGQVPTDGGWRIYSSGPGIYTNIVIGHLFGLRRYFDWMEFDPVLPRELDGGCCELIQDGQRNRYQFSVQGDCCSPKHITVNGVRLETLAKVDHRYRAGAVRIKRSAFRAALTLPDNLIQIDL